MMQLQKIEKFIKEKMQNRAPNLYRETFEKMYEFFTLYDLIEQTSHCALISEIYIKRSKYHPSVIRLSFVMHWSETTLIRFRKKYLLCYKLLFRGDIEAEIAAAGG